MILNLHPSLLPKYRGLKTHQRAIAPGYFECGCTIHAVTPKLDYGPFLGQARVKIFVNATANTLGHRVLFQEDRLNPTVLR